MVEDTQVDDSLHVWFEKFDRENPHVYEWFVKMARRGRGGR